MAIPTLLRQQVIDRAQSKCEYCYIHQDFSIYTHEIDHTIALKHGGLTIGRNLALACLSCNRHKGSDLTSLDPMSGDITPLFNPRKHQWTQHFRVQDGQILGLTAMGRTTVFLLRFNLPQAVFSRQLLIAQNDYP
jgi:HNH endonuclease